MVPIDPDQGNRRAPDLSHTVSRALAPLPTPGAARSSHATAAPRRAGAFTALVAIASLDRDPQAALAACAGKVSDRFPAAG